MTSCPHTEGAPGDGAAVEVGDQTVEDAQERRLAAPGRAGDERDAVADVQVIDVERAGWWRSDIGT